MTTFASLDLGQWLARLSIVDLAVAISAIAVAAVAGWLAGRFAERQFGPRLAAGTSLLAREPELGRRFHGGCPVAIDPPCRLAPARHYHWLDAITFQHGSDRQRPPPVELEHDRLLQLFGRVALELRTADHAGPRRGDDGVHLERCPADIRDIAGSVATAMQRMWKQKRWSEAGRPGSAKAARVAAARLPASHIDANIKRSATPAGAISSP